MHRHPSWAGRASLTELFQGMEGISCGSWDGVTITGIQVDSRLVQPGDLFVALPGQHTDGIRFLEEAIRNGARAAVIPRESAISPGIPVLKVRDSWKALALVSSRFYANPSGSMFVFGVTGTNGKSTVTHMVAKILEAAGKPSGIWSTPAVFSGKRCFRPKLTTPQAHEIQRFFREVLEAGMHHACIEVSSHASCFHRVTGVHFDLGAVTNLAKDHLDFHGDFQSYFQAKKAFVESLPEEAVCFLNAEDPWVMKMAEKARAEVITFGCCPDADLAASAIKYSLSGTVFRVKVAGRPDWPCPGEFTLNLGVPGRHNVLNSLIAAGAALSHGISLEVIQEALGNFALPPRRLEMMRIGPYIVINDVAMNEASYKAVLETMRELGFPSMVVVNALRGNRGPGVNAEIASLLAEYAADLDISPLIITESRSHVKKYEVDYLVRPEELHAFVETARQKGLDIHNHAELPDAIREGVEHLKPGGVLLLLGTFGMDEGAAIARELLINKIGGSCGDDDGQNRANGAANS